MPTDVKLYDYASFNNFWFGDVDVFNGRVTSRLICHKMVFCRADSLPFTQIVRGLDWYHVRPNK
jgi:hypothetical protein